MGLCNILSYHHLWGFYFCGVHWHMHMSVSLDYSWDLGGSWHPRARVHWTCGMPIGCLIWDNGCLMVRQPNMHGVVVYVMCGGRICYDTPCAGVHLSTALCRNLYNMCNGRALVRADALFFIAPPPPPPLKQWYYWLQWSKILCVRLVWHAEPQRKNVLSELFRCRGVCLHMEPIGRAVWFVP